MKLTEAQQKYVIRAKVYGSLVPSGKRQEAVCESLVQLGLFNKDEDGAYALVTEGEAE